MDSWIEQRLNDLNKHIQADMQLLNDFEEELRYETNPRIKGGYRRDIARQEESIAKYKGEYNRLKAELENDRNTSGLLNDINNKLEQMDDKLDWLQDGQRAIYANLNQMQLELLDCYEESQKTIVSTIIEKLDDNEVTLTNQILQALENNSIVDTEVEELLTIVEQTKHLLPANTQEALSETIENPKINAKQKLKLSVPIIPVLLKYELEYQLPAELGIPAKLQRFMQRFQR